MSDLSRLTAAIQPGRERLCTTENLERDGCTKRPPLPAPPHGTVKWSTPGKTFSPPTWKPTGLQRPLAIASTTGFQPTTVRTGRRWNPSPPSTLTTPATSLSGRPSSSVPPPFRGGLTLNTRPTTKRPGIGSHLRSTPEPKWGRFDPSGRRMYPPAPPSVWLFPTTTAARGWTPTTIRRPVSQRKQLGTPFDMRCSWTAPTPTRHPALTGSYSNTRKATPTDPCWTLEAMAPTIGNRIFSSTNPLLWLPMILQSARS